MGNVSTIQTYGPEFLISPDVQLILPCRGSPAGVGSEGGRRVMAPFGALLGLTLPSFSLAASTLSPQHGLANGTYTFVSSPNTRGTLDILWSSMFTIVACTWTVLHSHVPDPQQGDEKSPTDSRRQDLAVRLKQRLKNIWYDLKWVIGAILAPEFLLARSVQTLFRVLSLHRRFCSLGDDVARDWTLTHLFYAEMGGFVLRDDADSFQNTSRLLWLIEQIRRLPHPARVTDDLASAASLEEGFGPKSPQVEIVTAANQASGFNPKTPQVEIVAADVDASDFGTRSPQLETVDVVLPPAPETDKPVPKPEDPDYLELLPQILQESLSKCVSPTVTSPVCEPATNSTQPDDLFLDISPDYNVPYHVYSETILFAIEKGLIPRKPPITEDEIIDMAKTETFGKTVAIVQMLWFLLNVIVRGARGMKLSQLEIVVSAFCASSAATYVANSWKPSSIKTATTLMTFDSYIPPEVIEYQRDVYEANPSTRTSANTSKPLSTSLKRGILMLALQLGCMCFGAINLTAWNFLFPTKLDQKLWRCAAVISAAIPIISTLTANPKIFSAAVPRFGRDESEVDPQGVEGRGGDRGHRLLRFPLRFLSVLYILARLCIIVEMFRCLFHLPAGAFVTTWTSDIPHVT